MKGQYKRICFTVNLPDGKDWGDYDLDALRVELNPSFMIIGKETGKEGRKHFQGFFELDKRKNGNTIDRIFRKQWPLPISCHYEVAQGSTQQNIIYCSKEDKKPYQHGEPKAGQGTRTDLHQVFEDIKNGKDEKTVAEENPHLFLQHHRGLAKYRALVEPKRNTPTQLIFLWGPTGTGKTMHAQELNPVSVHWASNQFLNGFNAGDKVLLFDDFDYKKMDWQTFLTMTDRYPMMINVKGGAVNFAPTTIIFTSNSDPKGWWPDAPEETRKAIHRRMEEFGDIRFLGELVPKTTTLLDRYLVRGPEPASIASAIAAGAPGGALLPLAEDTQEQPRLKRTKAIIIKDNSEDSDSDHSAYSVRRRVRMRTERAESIENIVEIESDSENDEEEDSLL